MNSEEEKTNSEFSNSENEISIEEQKGANDNNEQTIDNKLDEKSKTIEDKYMLTYYKR